mgnify:CR=1 FL=1
MYRSMSCSGSPQVTAAEIAEIRETIAQDAYDGTVEPSYSIVPPGFAAKLRGMVESPELVLRTGRGGLAGRFELQFRPADAALRLRVAVFRDVPERFGGLVEFAVGEELVCARIVGAGDRAFELLEILPAADRVRGRVRVRPREGSRAGSGCSRRLERLAGVRRTDPTRVGRRRHRRNSFLPGG